MARAAIPQVQNLSKWSEDSSHVGYSSFQATLSQNAGIAPDGSNTANLLTADVGNSGVHWGINTNSTLLSKGYIVCVSGYLKANTGRYGVIGNDNNGLIRAIFDLQNGTMTYSDGITAGISPDPNGNGWYRVFVVADTSLQAGALHLGCIFYVTTNPTNINYTSNGESIYFWGLQYVRSNWPGPYTKTTSSIVDTGNLRFLSSNRAPVSGRAIIPTTQNFVPDSTNFAAASWTQSNLTLGSGVTDPFGGTDAFNLIENGVNSIHQIFCIPDSGSISIDGQDVTISIFAKKGIRNFLYIQRLSSAFSAFFDLNSGVTGTIGSSTGFARIKDFGNGWYRCSFTASLAQIGGFFQIQIASSSSITSYAGSNGSVGISIAFSQIVKANWPGPYQVTTGSIVNTGNIRNLINP